MYRLKNVVSRDIGFEGKHGTANSIVDVEGVEVGHETIVEDIEQNGGKTIAVRTGVSSILPQGREKLGKDYFCGVSTLNGNGEVTGISWVEESGMLSGSNNGLFLFLETVRQNPL